MGFFYTISITLVSAHGKMTSSNKVFEDYFNLLEDKYNLND